MDPTVNERRLRSVFDAIDIGNNKKALQEVEKVLKKTPNLKTALALKALALIRLGREKESQSFIEDLEASEPDDDPTLQVMTYCYRELNHLEKICKVYHNAAKKQPGNDEILSQLFMAHVRVNDFKSQQTVALQLYKSNPKSPYYFWAVMSIVLQAVRGPESKDTTKSRNLLTLAQRMIDKLIEGKKIEAEQEVQLYLNILECQNKYEESLTFLDSDICKEHFPGAPITLKIELLKKLGKWKELKEICEELLVEDPDRWDYWKNYLDSCFSFDTSMDSITAFIQSLQDKSQGKLRGPFLGRLQMHKMMSDRGLPATTTLGDYQDLLVNFFKNFGHKKCCVNDLKMFIEYLEPSKRYDLSLRLVQETGISSTALPQDRTQLQFHISSLQVSRLCGAHQSLEVEHLLAIYSALSLHYEHSFSTFDVHLLPTDIGLSDQYALLAAHVMFEVAAKLDSSFRLVEVLHLINYLLRNSPSNFHAKLICLQIFQLLGCTLGAHEIYQSLDIKHIQLDSLGYLHCAHLPITGLFTMAKPIYDRTLKFFTASYKDSLEYVALCYKYGSFSKLQEFMDFREKLSNSLHYSTTSVEALLQEIICFNGSSQQYFVYIQNMKIEPNEDRIKYDELMDNRDLDVMIRFDPTFEKNAENSEYIKKSTSEERGLKSFNEDIELLQIRSTMLRLVAASIELTTNSSANAGDDFKIIIQKWAELFIIAERTNEDNSKKCDFLANLLPSRLFHLLQLPYKEVFLSLSEFVHNMWSECIDASKSLETLSKAFETMRNTLDNLKPIDGDVPILYYRNLQSTIVGCFEIASLCLPVLLSCYEEFNKNSVQSGKKKKQSNNDNNKSKLPAKERVALTIEALKELKRTLQSCEKSLEKLRPLKVEKSLDEYLSTLSISPKPPKSINTLENANSVISTADIDIYSIFEKSYQLTSKEISSLIKEKVKMINVK